MNNYKKNQKDNDSLKGKSEERKTAEKADEDLKAKESEEFKAKAQGDSQKDAQKEFSKESQGNSKEAAKVAAPLSKQPESKAAESKAAESNSGKSKLFLQMEPITFKEAAIKLLNGVAIGIVIGLIPNAILGEVFKALLSKGAVWQTLQQIVYGIQSAVPVLVGACVAMQFKMNPIEMASLASVTFIGSGVLSYSDKIWQVRGIGDLINTMLVAAIGVFIIMLLRKRLGSLTMILLPVILSVTAGFLGVCMLPHVRKITVFIGGIIAEAIKLQPLAMCVVLSVMFAIIIVSPVSTVAIGIAVGLNGLASGAANMGIASCAMTLVIGSIYVNKVGISLALFLGSMKLFMPNWLRHPIMNLPIVLNGIVGGFITYFFNITGTPQSSGFGFSGLVGPINAYKGLTGAPSFRILMLFIAYFVLTTLGAYVIDKICVDVLKLYKRDIYIFNQN